MNSELFFLLELIIETSNFIICSSSFLYFSSSIKIFLSIISNQYFVSSASFKEIPSLLIKSALLTALCASLTFAPIESPLLVTCFDIKYFLFSFNKSSKSRISHAKSSVLLTIMLSLSFANS